MWRETDGKLVREFQFKDFQECFTFMTRVAFVAEQRHHHPTWVNTYNRLRIELTTHDAGNEVTSKDRDMALAIDGLLK